MRELTRDEAAILLKLYRKKKFGSSHILEDNLLQGFPPDRVGELRATLERMKADGIVRRKKSAHGPAVFLDPSMGKEIYDQLRKRYPWLPRPPWLPSE